MTKIHLASSMTRVEGYSEIVIHRKQDRIAGVSYKMPSTRDFQPLLIGQRIEDFPKIVARICGICPVSHRLAAVQAVEDALGITAPNQAKVLREVALLGEIVRSHAYSAFFGTLPDLLGLADQLSRKDILGLKETYPKFFSIGLATYKQASALVDRVAGNANMATTIVPGGVLNNITEEIQTELVKDAHSMLSSIQWIKSQYRSFLSQVREDINLFKIPSCYFITSFDTKQNWFSGGDDVTIITLDGQLVSFPSVHFPEQLLEDHDSDAPTRIMYSSKKDPEKHLLTGPHARIAALQLSSAESSRKEIGPPNLFQAGLFRLDEIEFCLTRIISMLEDKWVENEQLLTPWDVRSGTAGSAVEAPRGTLLYRLSIDGKGRVSGIQIRVPTELNAGALTFLVRQVVDSCISLGWSTDRSIEWAKMAIRCFDPCVSCATNTEVRFRD